MNETVLQNVQDSLNMMWKGMLGLFAVCGGIALIMSLISRIVRGKENQGKSPPQSGGEQNP